MQENCFQLCSTNFFQIAYLYYIDRIFTAAHVLKGDCIIQITQAHVHSVN